MGLSEDGDENTERQYDELCLELNMDAITKDEAWQAYERIKQNYTLEGNGIHWLACALYVACRKTKIPTVGRGVIEGNCVSLTRLLRTSRLSLIQFFNKMKKWCDMANLPADFREKIDRLERNFAVSTVIFKKFGPIFLEIFNDPALDVPKPPRSRKQRRLPCSVSDVFNFCWTMFVQVKGNFPAISDDLVNSYHLLLCCVDWIYSNSIQGYRRDLVNLEFSGLPQNFMNKDYKAPSEAQCILELLCERHDGIVLEAKGIKEHWWKPHIKKLFEKRVLKGGKVENLSGVLELNNFESNSKAINNAYEEYVLSVGDFDERVFLGEDANEEIGTPAKFTTVATGGELSDQMAVKKNLFEKQTNILGKSTPLTGRRYLKERDKNNVTPVSTATQGVGRLQALLCGRKTSPSEGLLDIFKNDCSRNPHETIIEMVRQMGDIFCEKFAMPSDDHPGSIIDFARKRLQLGESLYYKTLENILMAEKKRLANGNQKIDLSNLLEQDVFHRSLFACCLEIVIYSYNSQRTFPWIVEIFDLSPYYFYKVIEVLIRTEGELSRDVVKHLNCVEEHILDSLAWKADSPLWAAIDASGGTIPPFEEVSLPESSHNSGANPLQSPVLRHPAVHRLAGGEGKQSLIVKKVVDPLQSPTGPSASDRFSSPTPGSAKRRLFGPTQSNTSTTSSPTTTTQTQYLTFQQAQTPDGRQVLIPVTVIPTPSPQPSTPSSGGNTPVKSKKKTGSLALFFRKVYHLASVRMKDLCDRLDIDVDLRRKIWTCFEHCVVQHSELLADRHLDQFIMCSIYVMSKVTNEGQSFQDIMKVYRLQPQASSHVYRSVLLTTRHRRTSGSSDSSKNGASGSSSPLPFEEKEKEKKRAERLSSIRSSSTLPVPHPNSQPPTPTKMLGIASSFDLEDRGDLIKFYNSIFVKKLKDFAMKFSTQEKCPPLSPMPVMRSQTTSPRRQVSKKHEVFISPIKGVSSTPLSPSSRLLYCFNRSPAKDLRAINNMIRLGERKLMAGKRLLQDDDDSPVKRLRLENPGTNLMKKLQNMNNERQEANGNGQ